MALLRSIGNRFRRPDDRSESEHALQHQQPLQRIESPFSLSNKVFGALALDAHNVLDESPELYYEDRPLGNSIHALEDMRAALRELASAANEHKESLVAHAGNERSLGDTLQHVMHAPNSRASCDSLHERQMSLPHDENAHTAHFSSYLPIEAREAQKALGKSLALHSDTALKLSVAMSSPINELTRSFEERYKRKIIPLRKRYMDQKGQYLKYKRHADMADTDEKRSYYEALAEAAKPVWLRTSTELRTESDVMTELTCKNMAKWSKSVALQYERALAIAAANFADAFNRAKSIPSLSRSAK